MTNYEKLKSNVYDEKDMRDLFYRVALLGLNYFDNELCLECKKKHRGSCPHPELYDANGNLKFECTYEEADPILLWLQLPCHN